MSLDTIICPTDCTTAVPVVSFSECAPQVILGQINKVYLANVGHPMVNWADPAEWAARIDNASTDPDAIRELTVIGEKPRPEANAVDISNGRKAYGNRNYTLNVTIDDNSDDNYNFARYTGCNGTYLMWYATIGGYLYGNNAGIKASFILDEVNPVGPNDFATLQGEITWKSKLAPVRMLSPIAEEL